MQKLDFAGVRGLEWVPGMLQSVKMFQLDMVLKDLGEALSKLVKNISERSSERHLLTANFPRFLYKLAAEMGWRKSVKANA